MSVRIAFVGKGGVGKSVISATVARLLGRAGDDVLALDADTMPGLALSLGMDVGPEGLPETLAEQRENEGWVMADPSVTPDELVDRFAIAGPDRVRLLTLGKLPGNVKPGSTMAFRHVVGGFRRSGWSLVGDLAAGTRQAFFGWAGFARNVALVAEPSAKSVLSARRLARLAESMPGVTFAVIASKVREGDDPARVAAAIGLPLIGSVPYDGSVLDAERHGLTALDAVPEEPAMRAIAEIVTLVDPG